MIRLVVTLLLIGPVCAGLIGVLLPSVGYFPVAGQTDLGFHVYAQLLQWPGLAQSVWLSLSTGVAATVLSLAITLMILAALTAKRARLLRRILAPILAMPHAAVAFGLAFLIAPSGWVARVIAPVFGWDSPPDILILNDAWGGALVLGLVIKEIPFLLFMSMAVLPQLDVQNRIRVGLSLGYSRPIAWIYGALEPLLRLIRLPVLLALTYSVTVVDMAIILGPTTPPSLSVQVIKWMNDPDLAMRLLASAAAVVQLAVVGGAVFIWFAVEETIRWAIRSTAVRGNRLPVIGAGLQAASRSYVLVPIIYAAMIAVLAIWTVAGFWGFPDIWPDSISMRTINREASNLTQTIWTTMQIGLPVTCFAVVLAVVLMELNQPLAPWLLFAPLVMPQVTFLPGLQVLMLQIGLAQGAMPVMALHFIYVFPYVMLTLSRAYADLDPRYSQAGYALGGSVARVFLRIRLPMLLAPILSAFAIGFSVSVAQYLPTLLVGGGRVATITTEAVALASGGDRRAISVYAVGQIIAAIVGFVMAVGLPAILWRNRKGMQYV